MPISKLATPYKFENFGAVRWNSRGGTPITTIVVHHAATTNFNAMPDVWATREASAHYGIGQNGEIRAYVDEDKRAWHCGNGNSYSIGIECTNISLDPEWKVSDKTVDALVALIKEIQSRRGKLQIVGHKDVPGNATACPGPSLYPRLQEIRNRVNSTETLPPTGEQKPTQTKGEITMICFYQVDGKGPVFYFDGKEVRGLSHPDEQRVLNDIYKANNGKDIPTFHWSVKAPWHARLLGVLTRKPVK